MALFLWQSHTLLGIDPDGSASAHLASFERFPSGRYASFAVPFFSSAYLPPEKGLLASNASNSSFETFRVLRGDSAMPTHFCIRLSWDGVHVHQLCDPNDPVSGRTTGVVRAALEEFWNDLKRAHYMDPATRAMLVKVIAM